MERKLIGDFETAINDLLTHLTPETHALSVEIAALPMQIRGYGHIKEAAVKSYYEEAGNLMAGLKSPTPHANAAE